jgi:2-oxoglutarate ferredoxin oxidoreductase subunit beta
MAKIKPHGQLVEKHFLKRNFPSTWCPGCGIGTIVGAITRAVDATGIPSERFVFVTGIGCYGGAGSYLDYSDIHALHGRCPAYATGLKLANPEVYPILLMGDGDASAIGGNHLIHAARRNVDLTAIILNNHNYGMTGGQYSPTTPLKEHASTAPYGMVEHPFDLCKLVQGAGATFVARTTVYHVTQMVSFIQRAILHRGFAVVEVESLCPTYFGKRNQRGDPVEMLKWQRDHAVPLEKARRMNSAELLGKIITGIFVEEKKGEYVRDYYRLVKDVERH